MTPLTWNHDRELILPDKYQHSIGVGWRNYLDSGVWKTINTAIANDRTVTAFPGSVRFPLTAQGDMTTNFNHKFSMKRKIDEGNDYNPDDELAMSVRVLSDSNPTGHIDDNGYEMVYPNAWPNADLRLGVRHGRAARIEKIVEIHSMPAGDSQYITYQFEVTSPLAKLYAGPGHSHRPWSGNSGSSANLNGSSAFIALGDSPHRGAVIKTPKCWYFMPDGSKVEKNVRVNFVVKNDLETALATKYILRSDIQEALDNGSALFTDATFQPDASPETSSCDGRLTVQSVSSRSWSSMLGTTASSVADNVGSVSYEPAVYCTSTTNQFTSMMWSHYGFDTSSIGAGQEVTVATFRISGVGGTTSNNTYTGDPLFDWTFGASSPASNTALATTDFSSLGSALFLDTSIVKDDFEPGPVTNTYTLNATGRLHIDMEGVTNFGLAIEEAFTGVTPLWQSGSYVRWSSVNFVEYTTSGLRPLLTVTSQAASTKSFSSTVSSGVSKGVIK